MINNERNFNDEIIDNVPYLEPMDNFHNPIMNNFIDNNYYNDYPTHYNYINNVYYPVTYLPIPMIQNNNYINNIFIPNQIQGYQNDNLVNNNNTNQSNLINNTNLLNIIFDNLKTISTDNKNNEIKISVEGESINKFSISVKCTE